MIANNIGIFGEILFQNFVAEKFQWPRVGQTFTLFVNFYIINKAFVSILIISQKH